MLFLFRIWVNQQTDKLKCLCADAVEVVGHLPTALLPHTSVNKVEDRCVRKTTGWSACSASCGVGVSVRETNDNNDCVKTLERRLCVIRPCGADDSDLVCHVSINQSKFISGTRPIWHTHNRVDRQNRQTHIDRNIKNYTVTDGIKTVQSDRPNVKKIKNSGLDC